MTDHELEERVEELESRLDALREQALVFRC
jgi:uncharacterized coiled-coil protein SlyX